MRTMGVMRLNRELRICRASSIPSGEGMCKSRNTTSNFPSSRISGASVLLVRVNASMPAECKTFPISSQTAFSSSTTRPRLCMSPSGFSRSPVRRVHVALVGASHGTANQSRQEWKGGSRCECGFACWSASLESSSRFRSQNFMVVELDADTQLAPRRIDRLETHHVTRASPLRGRFAGDFLGHLEKDFDRRSDGYGRIRGEKGPCFREV